MGPLVIGDTLGYDLTVPTILIDFIHPPRHIRVRKMAPRNVSSHAMATHTPSRPWLWASQQAKDKRTHHMDSRLSLIHI